MHGGATPRIFENAKMLRANRTTQEKLLWEYLKSKPSGFKFRQQHPFNKYVLDFYCHKLKLSIEIDGESHNTEKSKLLDQQRTEILGDFGLREIRFSNRMVSNFFEIVVKEIETYFV